MMDEHDAWYADGYRQGFNNAARIDIPNWLTDNGFREASVALVDLLDHPERMREELRAAYQRLRNLLDEGDPSERRVSGGVTDD